IPVGGQPCQSMRTTHRRVLDGNLVEQRDGMENVDKIVEPVLASGPHRQLEVDLRGNPHGYGGINGHKSPIVKEPPILREHKPPKGRISVHDLPSARSPVRPVPGFRASGLVTSAITAMPGPLKAPVRVMSGKQGTNAATLGRGGVWTPSGRVACRRMGSRRIWNRWQTEIRPPSVPTCCPGSWVAAVWAPCT